MLFVEGFPASRAASSTDRDPLATVVRKIARERISAAQTANILPDGGTHYIASQNESAGYHGIVASFIARTCECTADPEALAMLRRLEWYGRFTSAATLRTIS